MRRKPLTVSTTFLALAFALAFSLLPLLPAGARAQARPAAPAAQARPRPLPASAPRLIVVLTVDQMRADYLERWRPQLTGGLARLLHTGAWFTEAYQDHAMTETAVGHATVLAGRNPDAHGIIRNAEGANDGGSPLIGVVGPGASPLRFRGTTLIDWLLARSPQSRVLSVSRKDRGAILPIGRARQMIYWYTAGQFTTSTYYADSLPGWLVAFNARRVPARAAGLTWEPLLPADSYPEPDSAPWENGGVDLTFPHRMPVDTADAVRAFSSMPWMDQLTLDLALEGIQAARLGRGPAPDILGISLSATDAIGHDWGPYSREIHDQILRLDRMLGVFLDSLARLRDPRRTVVVLTSDHGVTPFSGWARRNGFPAAENVSFDSLIRATAEALAERAGPGRWIRVWDLGLLAMDRAGLVARGVNVDSVVDALAAAFRAHRAVLRADTPRSLAAADTAQDALARRWRNAVPPDVGAELLVTLKPMFSLGSASYAQHGQPSDDDTHVPLLFAGPGVRAGRFETRVSMVDIAPTLARLLGVEPTEPVQGRVLVEALVAGRR